MQWLPPPQGSMSFSSLGPPQAPEIQPALLFPAAQQWWLPLHLRPVDTALPFPLASFTADAYLTMTSFFRVGITCVSVSFLIHSSTNAVSMVILSDFPHASSTIICSVVPARKHVCEADTHRFECLCHAHGVDIAILPVTGLSESLTVTRLHLLISEWTFRDGCAHYLGLAGSEQFLYFDALTQTLLNSTFCLQRIIW